MIDFKVIVCYWSSKRCRVRIEISSLPFSANSGTISSPAASTFSAFSISSSTAEISYNPPLQANKHNKINN